MSKVLAKLWDFIKKYSNYLIFILIAVLTIYIIRKEVDYKELIRVLAHSDFKYLGLAFLFLFLYWIMESYMLERLIKYEYPDESFKHAFSLAMIGMYYNQITPGASGGQPLQLIEMVSKGIAPGFATAVLVQKYALYQLSVTVIGLVGICFNIPAIMSWQPLGRIMLVLGSAVNVAGSIIILIVAFRPKYAKSILNFFIKAGLFLHLIKDKEKWFSRVDRFVDDYKLAIAGLKERIPEAIGLFIFNLAAIVVFYMISFWIYKALGLSNITIWQIVMIQAILYLMITFVPLPGAAGGAEVGFAIVFGAMFGAAEASIALVTWRVITFYFVLAFGGIFIALRTLFLANKPVKKLTSRSKGESIERD